MKRRERGATILEAALVFLLLFTFTMAIIEFGRVLSMYQTITNAAREGARFGTAPCQSVVDQACSYGGYPYQSGQLPSAHSIKAMVGSFLAAQNIKPSVIDVQWGRDDYTLNANGVSVPVTYRHVSVDVTVNYDWIFFPFPDLPLHTQAVMKHELDLE